MNVANSLYYKLGENEMMKRIADFLICAYVAKCLYQFGVDTATIADAFFLIVSVLYILVFIIKLPTSSPRSEGN